MVDSNYREELKQYIPFWDKLSSNEQEFFMNNVLDLKYESGTTLHGGDDDCLGLILIRNGTIRTYMLSNEGKEITLFRLNEGEVCVLSAACILDSVTFDVNIDAETDCEIFLLGSTAFAKLASSNIYVENFAHKIATERFSDVMWAFEQILFMSFDKRLATFLFDEYIKIKDKDNVIKLTHEQVAKYIGSAREVVTRMLHYFANEGIVEVSRGGIKILMSKN
ncbi:MAG: Crp/Fnr family transcriptional regulator [Eubacteriales bacterium]